jgi:hypothetical protein
VPVSVPEAEPCRSQDGVLGAGGLLLHGTAQPANQAVPVHRSSSHPQLAICDWGAIIPIAGGGNNRNLPRPCVASGCKASGCQLVACRSTGDQDSFGYEAPGRYGSLARDQGIGGCPRSRRSAAS